MRRRWAVVLGVLACLLPLTPSPARANHTPLNEDGLKWENAAGADFNLEIAWTQGYVAQGAAFQQRVRDVVARDPSCFAGSCTSTSYARWYLHQAQPYFGGAESTVADFDPRSGTPVHAAEWREASRCTGSLPPDRTPWRRRGAAPTTPPTPGGSSRPRSWSTPARRLPGPSIPLRPTVSLVPTYGSPPVRPMPTMMPRRAAPTT